MQIEVVPLLKDNFAYLLVNDGRATIIDPSEAKPVIKALQTRGLTLEMILCTHHHPDHVGGAVELAKKYECPIWASKWDQERISGVVFGLDESDSPGIAGEPMRVLHVPGHTTGQVSYYFPLSESLFVGDTLFSLGCGRLFEGTPAEMFASLKKLMALPDSTKIYFGHEYTLRNGEFAQSLTPESRDLRDYLLSTKERLAKGLHSTPTLMGREKRLNPFLNTPSLEEWTKRRELRNVF